MLRPSPRNLDAVGTAVRLGFAAVWLPSDGLKAADPGGTRWEPCSWWGR